MSPCVRVLNITHVLPDQNRASVYSPLPEHLPDGGIMELSFMDSLFVDRVMPMRRLFFYEGPGVPTFPDLVGSLRASLATVLAIFFPLAGKLTYRPSAGDVVLDCSPAAVSSGVKFVEAEYAGSIDDLRRVASGGGEGHREALMELGPELDATQLPAPVLAVQVTRPAVGSGRAVMVGVAIHHAAADGHSVWQFMRAWTAVSRSRTEEGSEAMARLVPPTFERTVIRRRYPEAEELRLKILRAIAPALPVVRSPSSCSPPEQSRRSFLVHADEIRSVKEHIWTQTEAVSERLDEPPSTYVAVSSLVWTSIARAKSPPVAGDDAHYFLFLVAVDYRRRRRLGPEVDERYFGNCVVPCVASAAARDLCGGAGLARAAAAIRDAVCAQPEDPVRAMESWLDSLLAAPKERFTFTGSSNRFMAYETDFGWGAPSRVELVSPFAAELVLLVGADGGGVQVSVTLDPRHMEGFASNLLRAAARGNEA